MAAVYLEYGINKVQEIVYDVLKQDNILAHMNLFNEEKDNKKKKISNDFKINYKKIFKSIIGKKTQFKYVEENNLSNKHILNLEVNGKRLSQGVGKNKEIAKKDAIKKACIKLITENNKYNINYKSIIISIVGKKSEVLYIQTQKSVNKYIIDLKINGEYFAVGRGKNIKESTEDAARKACLKLIK